MELIFDDGGGEYGQRERERERGGGGEREKLKSCRNDMDTDERETEQFDVTHEQSHLTDHWDNSSPTLICTYVPHTQHIAMHLEHTSY